MQNEKQPDNNSGGSGKDTASIHIGKENYKSPNPTTGQALYALGKVDATQYDLFHEVHGKGDDELIANDMTIIQLKDGDHFYTAQKSLNPGAPWKKN